MRVRGSGRVGAAALSLLLAGPLVVAGGALASYAAASSHLLRYPYLTDMTTKSAIVNFATDASAPAATVTFGPAGSGCAASSVTATATTITVGSRTEYQFKAQLTGLAANTSYCYRAAQNGVDLLASDASPTFSTAVASGAATPYSFAVLGDWGAGTSDEGNVLSRIAASPAKFVVTVGDNVYNSGTQTEYGDLSGGNVFASGLWKGVGATRPVFAAQGNHGFSQNLPYLQNFPEPSVVQASGGRLQQDTYCCIPPMPSSKSYASAWYAFDWGSARFYVLEAAWSDSNGAYQGDFDAHWNGPVPGCPTCGTELQWLKSDLAAHASTPLKFAFFHYPLHADSSAQPSDTYLDGPNSLEGLLANNGVQIAFNGHAHLYERNRPQIPGSSMVSYVTGGGGDALGAVGGCSAFDAYAIGSGSSCNAPKPTSSTQVFHYLLVSVAGNTVTVTPTDENGHTFDVQTYTAGAPNPNDFSMSANPSTLSVNPGQSAASTISTKITNGSAQNVALSSSGLPSGATATFSPATISSGQSTTMTIKTSASTPQGTSTVTVTGTGASATRTTTITLTVGTSGGSQVRLVQAAGAAESSAATSLTGTFPAQTAGGHLLVLSASVYTGATNPISSVTDSAGNTWTRIGRFAVSGHFSDGEMWYAANAAPVTSVTVHTASAVVVSLGVQEFSGVAATNALDVSTGTANTSTSPASGSATPTGSTDLVVGFVAGHGTSQPITVSSPGYAVQTQQTSGSGSTIASLVTGDKVLTSGGAQGFTATVSSAMYWAAGVACFRAA
jgi:hypothetical protein